MSAVTDYDQRGRHYVETMELIFGRSKTARMLGVGEETLKNVKYQRRKSLSAHLYEKIRGGLIHGLETEIARLQHEVAIARASVLGGDDDAIGEAQVALDRAKALIRGVAR